jgi:hypothetical protein
MAGCTSPRAEPRSQGTCAMWTLPFAQAVEGLNLVLRVVVGVAGRIRAKEVVIYAPSWNLDHEHYDLTLSLHFREVGPALYSRLAEVQEPGCMLATKFAETAQCVGLVKSVHVGLIAGIPAQLELLL